MYDNKYCMVLMIAYCDMQSENGPTHTLFGQELNYIMMESGISNLNFKIFMTDNAHANWNVVRNIW